MKKGRRKDAAALQNDEVGLVGEGGLVDSRNRGDFEHVVGCAAMPERSEEDGSRGRQHRQKRVEQTARVLLRRLLAGRQRGSGEEKPRFDGNLLPLGGKPLLALHVQRAVRPDRERRRLEGCGHLGQPRQRRNHIGGRGCVTLGGVAIEEATCEKSGWK